MAGLLRERLVSGAGGRSAERLLAAWGAAEPGPTLVEPLSPRELEVLRLLDQGKANATIAAELIVSVNTVKTHLRHVYEKLGVNNRRAAVARARELSLLPRRDADERG
jgi:LuxR family maltose regulon positive regulatory protein